MDKIFGEADAVEAGENEEVVDKVEALALSKVEHDEKEGKEAAVTRTAERDPDEVV
jgi:hypothetical protein